MIKLLAFRIAAWLVPKVPVALSYGVAWLGAEIAYRFVPSRRRAVASNLRRVMGIDEVSGAVRSVFHTQAYNYADLFLMPRLNPGWLTERLEITNLPSFLHACDQGKGVIIATAHLGNFDLLVQVTQSLNVPAAVLVERLEPEALHQTVVRLRGAHGIRLIPAGPAGLREAVRLLKSGGVLAIGADRDLQRKGEPMSFFGAPARMPIGAIELAKRTGAALVPAFGLRLPGRRYRITIEPPIVPDAGTLIGVMERYIREHPEQWIVFQELWGAPAASPPEERVPVLAR
jgi:phosphatidylinositol dimannoside acyltransferase